MNETVCPECGCWAGHTAACTYKARHFITFTSSESIRLSDLEVCYDGRLIDHHRRDLGPCPECASRNYDKGDISKERENLDIPTPSTRNLADISMEGDVVNETTGYFVASGGIKVAESSLKAWLFQLTDGEMLKVIRTEECLALFREKTNELYIVRTKDQEDK